ncbi:FGGY family carbohydrate kinase, partial [Micromonospora sp. NPDC048898]|uniref:FGGY family carbohydrate kinase n=1 Tax=Micromonospora sp. NPDC048898 TaxID=3364260 RepID=UPI00370FE5CC
MGPERRVILGVDVGTTTVRVGAFALDGSARHVRTRAYPLLQPLPGWQVQDPDVLVAATLAAVSACVADIAGAEVVALAVSSPRYGGGGGGGGRPAPPPPPPPPPPPRGSAVRPAPWPPSTTPA